jgi:hypothetical protein
MNLGPMFSLMMHPQSLQANVRIISQIRPQFLPSKSYPIYYPVIILTFSMHRASKSTVK